MQQDETDESKGDQGVNERNDSSQVCDPFSHGARRSGPIAVKSMDGGHGVRKSCDAIWGVRNTPEGRLSRPPERPQRLPLWGYYDQVVEEEADDPPASAQAFPGAVQPLTPEQRALLYGSKPDEAPEFLDGVNPSKYGLHFLASDEWNHHVFEPHIRDVAKGGGYVGVGASQGYVMMGWARPEYAWFIDYDDVIVELHEVWHDLFEVAENNEDFQRLWSKKGRKDGSGQPDFHDDEARRAPVIDYERGQYLARCQENRAHRQRSKHPGKGQNAQ